MRALAGKASAVIRPAEGRKSRILGIEPDLDGGAAGLTILEVKIFAGRLPDHPFHQIDAGGLFGDAMFNLQPGIDLEEIEVPGGGIIDEFHCAGALIAHTCHQPSGGVQKLDTDLVREIRRRRLFDHLLIAPLRRTVAFAQSDDPAFAVAKDLRLDMATGGDIFLQKQSGIGEIVLRQSEGPLEQLGQLAFMAAALQPDTATAGGALDHQRVADTGGLHAGLLQRCDQAAAGRQRHPDRLGLGAGGMFETEQPHLLRRRTDEHQPGAGAMFGEIGIFRQEAIAGMDGFGTAIEGSLNDGIALQIALGGRSRTEPHRLAGPQHMGGVSVGIGIDRDRGNAEPVEAAQDPAGDLAAIGDQDLAEHQDHTSTSIGVGS